MAPSGTGRESRRHPPLGDGYDHPSDTGAEQHPSLLDSRERSRVTRSDNSVRKCEESGGHSPSFRLAVGHNHRRRLSKSWSQLFRTLRPNAIHTAAQCPVRVVASTCVWTWGAAVRQRAQREAGVAVATCLSIHRGRSITSVRTSRCCQTGRAPADEPIRQVTVELRMPHGAPQSGAGLESSKTHRSPA